MFGLTAEYQHELSWHKVFRYLIRLPRALTAVLNSVVSVFCFLHPDDLLSSYSIIPSAEIQTAQGFVSYMEYK